ncbi:hypothetical protein D3229_03240 [Leucobacter aridicollis]|nr:hypothetical protein [Leucobacter aridicollis]
MGGGSAHPGSRRLHARLIADHPQGRPRGGSGRRRHDVDRRARGLAGRAAPGHLPRTGIGIGSATRSDHCPCAPRHPRARRGHCRRRRRARLRARCPGRGEFVRRRRADSHVGVQRRVRRADAPRGAGRARPRCRAQRARRGDDDALARHEASGDRRRRPAPAHRAGLFIVDDAEPPVDAPLPREYGVDDIPVVVTDRSFSADGTFDERRRDAAGMLGDTLLVNGTVSPRFAATRELTRLRILNGSTARSYRFELDAGPLLLVGTDSGLLPEPVEVPGVTLTPGERAEVVVALAPGASAMLRSVPHTLGLLDTTERASGTGDTFEVLELTRDGATARPAAATLADLTGWIAAGGALAAPLTDPPEPDRRRTITLQDNKINHRRMNMARIDEVVTVGDRERWLITNEHFLPHNLHIHNARFRVHSVEGRAPTAELRGWKDTVYAPPSRTVVIDVEFGTSTDPHLPYMFHCHLLQHEDQGMMAQFVVVRPGEEAGPLDTPAIRDGGSHDGH